MVARVKKTKKKLPANQVRTLFKKGNKLAQGKGYPLVKRRTQRFLTMGMIENLEEQIMQDLFDVDGKPIHDKTGKRRKAAIDKAKHFINQLYKGAVVDRNPACFKLILEMVEGKEPQKIDIRQQSVTINKNMSLQEMSRYYLEEIKKTEPDEDYEP